MEPQSENGVKKDAIREAIFDLVILEMFLGPQWLLVIFLGPCEDFCKLLRQWCPKAPFTLISFIFTVFLPKDYVGLVWG